MLAARCRRRRRRAPACGAWPAALRRWSALTIVAGGFVAGLHAGLIYNTFPLMDGRLVPAGYATLHPFLRNLTENIAAVQFDHRLLATLTALAALAAVVDRAARGAAGGTCAALLRARRRGRCCNTRSASPRLLLVVPVPLAAAHQAVAVLLLTAALAATASPADAPRLASALQPVGAATSRSP